MSTGLDKFRRKQVVVRRSITINLDEKDYVRFSTLATEAGYKPLPRGRQVHADRKEGFGYFAKKLFLDKIEQIEVEEEAKKTPQTQEQHV